MKLFNLATLILLLVILALPFAASAQDDSLPASAPATLVLPPMLLGLMALNNRTTEALKLYLTSKDLPFTPPDSVRSLIVLVFSILFGIASAYVTPNANEWLGESFAAYPLVGFVVTGFVVSLGAGAAQMVMALLQGLGASKATYSTTTTINTPPADTPPAMAKQTLDAASQVAGNEAKG